MENLNYNAQNPSKIKVFGIGGGGSNDRQHLEFLDQIPNRIPIGENVTKGLGAGGQRRV